MSLVNTPLQELTNPTITTRQTIKIYDGPGVEQHPHTNHMRIPKPTGGKIQTSPVVNSIKLGPFYYSLTQNGTVYITPMPRSNAWPIPSISPIIPRRRGAFRL